LPFILRAGISQINSGGTDAFMRSLYLNSPLDMKLLENPEVRGLIQHGYRFATHQGHHAFEIDSYHVVRDWRHLVAATDLPVHLVHGVHDPVVSLESVQDFAASLGARAMLDAVEGAGQLVMHQSPDPILDAMDLIWT